MNTRLTPGFIGTIGNVLVLDFLCKHGIGYFR